MAGKRTPIRIASYSPSSWLCTAPSRPLEASRRPSPSHHTTSSRNSHLPPSRPFATTRTHASTSLPSTTSPRTRTRPPRIDIHDPAVFSHPSIGGDLKVFTFERPPPLVRKWQKRVETFEKHEHFGKSLLSMNLTELVTIQYTALSVPAVAAIVDRLLSKQILVELAFHYELALRLEADSVAKAYYRLAPSTHISLFYAYVAGIYHQEGFEYARQWIKECFQSHVSEVYESYKVELFAKSEDEKKRALERVTSGLDGEDEDAWRLIEDDRSLEGTESVKKTPRLRNASPVIPDLYPLQAFDAYLKKHKRGSRWNLSVKGASPNETFKAVVESAGRRAEGSGNTKQAAKQAAAAAFIATHELDVRFIDYAVKPIASTDYTPKLHSLARERNLGKPAFTTVADQHPYYIATLIVGGKTFVAREKGKVEARKEAARLALETFEPSTSSRELVRLYCRNEHFSHRYETSIDGSLPRHKCVLTIGEKTRSEEKETMMLSSVGGEYIGWGMSQGFAKSSAALRAVEKLNIDKTQFEEKVDSRVTEIDPANSETMEEKTENLDRAHGEDSIPQLVMQ